MPRIGLISMSKSVRNVSKTPTCVDNPDVIEPKKLLLVGIAMLIIGILVGRMYNAFQRAGLAGSPNVVGGFHFHHWLIALFALVLLFPLAIYFHTRNRKVFTVLVVVIFFFTGLFVDGIMYPDSFIFYQ
jgi:asparagine N-glycosylation enzyme membrane subunit Stt3